MMQHEKERHERKNQLSGKIRTLMHRFEFQAMQRENKYLLDFQQILLQELEKQQ